MFKEYAVPDSGIDAKKKRKKKIQSRRKKSETRIEYLIYNENRKT